MKMIYALVAYAAYYLHRVACHDKSDHHHQWWRVSIEHRAPPVVP